MVVITLAVAAARTAWREGWRPTQQRPYQAKHRAEDQ